MKESEEIAKLHNKITSLESEVVKLQAALKEQYDFAWFVRELLTNKHGKVVKQRDDMMGVNMPDGTFVQYGKDYHYLYFIGAIQ